MNKVFLAVLLALAPLVMVHAADQIPASAPTPVSAVASAVASVALADAGLPPDAAPPSVAPSVAPSAAPSAVASLPANPEDLGAVLQAGRVNGWSLPYLLAMLTALCTALIAIARNAGFLTSKNGPVAASVLVGVVYGRLKRSISAAGRRR